MCAKSYTFQSDSDMAPRFQSLSGILTIATLLLLAWQYTVFDGDHRRLLEEVDVLEQAYGSLQDLHSLSLHHDEHVARMEKLIKEIPMGDSEDIGFLKAIRTTCLLNNSTCQLLEKKSLPNTFHNEKKIRFKITGLFDDIQAILHEIEHSPRLINWASTCISEEMTPSGQVSIEISFVMYHFPHLTFAMEESIDRPELETKTWLPPFTYYLNKTKEKAETIYDLLMVTPNAADQLNQFRKFNWENDRLLQMESILKTLKERRRSLELQFDNISICKNA